jgi:transposase
MLSINGSVKIFIATDPIDCRKSHDALAALAEHVLRENPLSGNLFLFINKRADRIKMLYWDGDGYALWYKRIEAGRVKLPKPPENATRMEVSAVDLAMILSGIDLTGVRRLKRFQIPEKMLENSRK